MGQKYAAYDANGTITGFYDDVDSPVPGGLSAIKITDAEWQDAIANQGKYSAVNGVFTAANPWPSLSATKTAQINAVSSDCQGAIEAGFSSSALGSANTYGCKATDQSNINAAALNGGSLWRRDSTGAWVFQSHTAAQAQQVQKDMVTHIQAEQSHYATLVGKINDATTVSAVQAVVW